MNRDYGKRSAVTGYANGGQIGDEGMPPAPPPAGSVGLIDRLRAGNIDARGSEAYNRFNPAAAADAAGSDARVAAARTPAVSTASAPAAGGEASNDDVAAMASPSTYTDPTEKDVKAASAPAPAPAPKPKRLKMPTAAAPATGGLAGGLSSGLRQGAATVKAMRDADLIPADKLTHNYDAIPLANGGFLQDGMGSDACVTGTAGGAKHYGKK